MQLLLGLVAMWTMLTRCWTSQSDGSCRWCYDVTSVTRAPGYSCGHCVSIPDDLPRNLTYLELTFLQRKHILDQDFQQYPEISELHLQKNNIESVDPHVFSSLYKLESLILTSNKLRALPRLPQSVRNLQLGGNDVTAAVFKHCSNLRQLNLESNRLTGLHVHRAPQLRQLNVHNNRLRTLTLHGVTSLRVLVVSSNEFRELPSLPGNLVTLRVGHNKLCGLPALELPHLEQLLLPHNDVSSLTADSFRFLVALTTLDLRHNPIVELDPGLVPLLSNLDVLKLPMNTMTQVQALAVSRAPGHPLYLWVVAGGSCLVFTVVLLIGVVVLCLPAGGARRGPQRRSHRHLLTSQLCDKRGGVVNIVTEDDSETARLISASSGNTHFHDL